MAGFARVHKKGRRPRGRQGRRDLAAHMAAFAHAHHHHPAAQGENAFDDLRKRRGQAVRQGLEGLGLDTEGVTGQFQSPRAIKRAHGGSSRFHARILVPAGAHRSAALTWAPACLHCCHCSTPASWRRLPPTSPLPCSHSPSTTTSGNTYAPCPTGPRRACSSATSRPCCKTPRSFAC
ncbi:hypothetical protein D3C78_1302790 [compost metagenome]